VALVSRLDPLLSSGKDDWATPREVFDPLHREFGFKVDVCAEQKNAKCLHWYGPLGVRRDAMGPEPWEGPAFMNPPYSELKRWCARALGETLRTGQTIVALIPLVRRVWVDE
jgi:phage N-6-adenine-methyltransferase